MDMEWVEAGICRVRRVSSRAMGRGEKKVVHEKESRSLQAIRCWRCRYSSQIGEDRGNTVYVKM